ncbi:MAG TPA: peptidylprolyl isomerase [Bacteroidales bacterium]|nr:peptidylprolyl isomerase [Bacteroidales bacterium]
MKKTFALIILTFISIFLLSQEVIDQVVAVVGNEIILKSDIENQYIQIISQGYNLEESDLKCDILEELMFQKLLYLQALEDSIVVSDKEVETELDRRINVFINQLGSESKLEEYYGKTIAEIKNDFREVIEEQLLTQRVQSNLTADAKVTPSEIKAYYESIPVDSLPMVEAYFELSEIVISPQIGETEKNAAIEKLNGIRDRIINGESFATMAILYSEDPGSANKGGELGFVSRNDLVPEFASVAFNLTSPEEVSRVVETEYGFHIIQLIERKGNMMNFRHILLNPVVSIEQIEIAEKRAEEVYELIISDSISFNEAVKSYSDSDTKFNNGKVMNPYYGNTKLGDDYVDPYTRKALSGLKPGEISKPFLATNNRGRKEMKIIRLDTKVDSHVANLKDDYQELQQYALQLENQKIIEKWINNKLKSTYIRIDESYSNCNFKFGDWYKTGDAK